MVIRKCRKPHKCTKCANLICAGESYELSVLVYDGAPQYVRYCASCSSTVQEANR